MADANHAVDFDPGTDSYVIGVDYGTLSGRAVVVRVRTARNSAAACSSTRTPW